jgi:Tol biopolymer transport system component
MYIAPFGCYEAGLGMNNKHVPVPATVNSGRNYWAWAYCGILLLISFALFTLSNRLENDQPGPTQTLQLLCGTQPSHAPGSGHSQIAFASRTNWGNSEICIMNVDGSGSYAVTKNGRNNSIQAWSPDNRQLLVESGSGWDTGVYLMNVDGSNEIRVSQTKRAIGGDWSPDGKRIVYTAIDGLYPAHIVNADGTNDVELPTLEGNSRPRWSPDGRKLLFWSARGGQGVQIYTVDINGTNLLQLTTHGENLDPRWSPDGSKIIFVSDRDYLPPPTPTSAMAALITGTPLQGIYQIYVMDADGSNIKKLTRSGDNFRPSCSADGTKIAFERVVGDNHQIYIMDADGSHMIQLTHIGYNYGPVWSRS